MKLPLEQRRQTLAKLPPETQVDLYVYAATKREPPFLLGEIAENWKSVLPVVEKRLSTERSDEARYQLVWLLVAIAENYCFLSDQTDVLERASRAANDAGVYSAGALDGLERLRHSHNLVLPPCQ